MAKHYNLYYLFLEDKNANLLASEKRKQIKFIVLDRYRQFTITDQSPSSKPHGINPKTDASE